MLRILIVVIFGTALPPAADAAEWRLFAGRWDYGLTGSVTDQGERLDFQDDLALKSERHASALFEYGGAGGWWPDWALGYSQIGARGRFEETFTLFIGPVPVGSETVRRDTDGHFNDLELVLRYPLARGGVKAAAGIALKHLKGEILIREEGEEPIREVYDEVFPLLHGQLRRSLGSWLALAGTAQGLSYRGNSAREWRAVVEIRPLRRLVLEIGWQDKRYRINAGGYALDARFDGLLARAGLVFGG